MATGNCEVNYSTCFIIWLVHLLFNNWKEQLFLPNTDPSRELLTDISQTSTIKSCTKEVQWGIKDYFLCYLADSLKFKNKVKISV